MDAVAVVPSTGGGVVNDVALQLWAPKVGLGAEVGRLIAARSELTSVLAEAQGKEIQNQALVLHLREAWYKASRAADLLSELDYYRIHGEMERHDDKLLHEAADQKLLLATTESDIKSFNNHYIAGSDEDTTDSSFSSEDSWSSALQVVPYSPGTVVIGNTSPVHRLEAHISEHIEECRTMAMDVRKALELEKLDDHIVKRYHGTRTDPRETSPYQTETKVYGRDQERDIIISKLTCDEPTRTQLSVLAIVGHGGVGKTTLAKLVFNHPTVSKHFDIPLWVYVSAHFDQVKIMRELLDTLCQDNHENIKKSEDLQLQEKLEYMLKSKRVLLVMDDMWEDSEKEKWNEVLNLLLTNGVNGNRVLVTTRKPSVATMIGASDSNRINLEGLNKADFWCLFKECAFGDGNLKGERKLEKIGRQIVEKLKGNPLAAKTLGKVLRGRFGVDYWRRILDSSEWKHKGDEDDIMPALMISYKHLPIHLQRCFSYCAVFPKYHRYEKERLVNMWIALDLIYCPDMHRRLEDIGIDYFNDLVDVGFLEKQSKFSSLLVMHDLIHDLAQKVSSDESFTIENSEPSNAQQLVRYVSVITEREYRTEINGTVHPNELFCREFSKSLRKLQQRSLSTLMLFGPHDLSFADAFRQELNEVRSIRVLKLEMVFFELDALIGNISAFINLRYLELGGFHQEPNRLELPEAICRLYHLQVLDIKKNWGASTMLPKGISKLVNLRHFIAEKELHAKIANIGNMVSLQELRVFDVKKESAFSISQLKGLNQLRGSISITSLHNVGDKEATEARLCDKVYLNSLELSWLTLSGSIRRRPSTVPILEDLVPPSGLTNLRIVAYKHALPSWLSNSVHLTSLRSIHLVNCVRWRTIPHPQQLPLLQEMHLVNLSLVRKIEVGGPLKILELRRMQYLSECILIDKEQTYTNLQVLEVEDCPGLNEFLSQIFIPSTTHQFVDLRRLQIRNEHIPSSIPIPLLQFITINSLEDIDLCDRPQEKGFFRLEPRGASGAFNVQIEENKNIQKLDEIFVTLHKSKNLRELEIRDYSIVTSEGFQQLTSLKSLRMIRCPEISCTNPELFLPSSIEELIFSSCKITGAELSQFLQNLHSLQNLELTGCLGITSIPVGLFTDEQNETSEGSWSIPPNCMSSMQTLQISFTRAKEDPSSMMHFSSKKGLGRFVSLEKIVIEDCLPLLYRMLSGAESHISPSSLVKLHINGVKDNVLHFSQVSSIVDLEVSGCPSLVVLNLNACTVLEKLHVRGCCSLRSIEDLQFCVALRDLHVTDCDLLPSLGASLSSLEILIIQGNKSLASLDLQSCTALQKLCIEDCPALISWEGLEFLTSLENLEIKRSPGFTRSWVSAAAEVKSEHNFSLPLKKLYTDDLDFLCVPICSQLTSLKALSIYGTNYGTVIDEDDDGDSDSDGNCDAGHVYVDIFVDNHEKGLRLLTSLRQLQLKDFKRLQSFPAGLSSLTSLQKLYIDDCGCLTSLPVEVLPDSLKDIDLHGCCEELKAGCRAMVGVRKLNLFVNGTYYDGTAVED